MGQTDFGGIGTSVIGFTNVYAYSYVPMPAGRANAAGRTPARITAMRAWASGRGGTRNIYLSVDGGSATSAFARGAAGSAGDTGAQSCTPFLVSGGTGVFNIYGDGSFYFGRGGGGATVDNNGTSYSGTLGGSFYWDECPTAPQTPAVAAGATSGTADLTWAAPTTDGGTALTGYRVLYSTASNLAGATAVDVGVVTSTTLTGLTPGQRYYFAVGARNAVTALDSNTTSVLSSIVNALIGDLPGAPTGLALSAGPGLIAATWTAPASDGGVAIDAYRLDYSTGSGFGPGTYTSVTLPAGARSATVTDLVPEQTYYARVVAHNSVGYGPASGNANATVPARGALDAVQGAAVHISGGVQVELRGDGATPAAVTLGYIAFGTGSAFTSIASIPIGSGATDFAAGGGPRNLALAADPAGNLYVIGRQGSNPSAVLVKRFERSGTTAWALDGQLAQALPGTTDALVAFAAAYVPATGTTAPAASILLLARRAGTVGAGSLSYATLDLVSIEASAGALFIASGSDPSWLATPPVGAAANSGVVDVAALTPGGTRMALLANGFAVVDVVNGMVTGVSKAAAGTTVAGPWARVIGVNATTLALFTVVGGALTWSFISATGSVLGTGSFAGANAYGGAFSSQWDAYYDAVAQLVTVYYVADPAGARTLESIDVSPATYAASAITALTAALGPASSTNGELRVPRGRVDERRVVVGAANIVTATSAKSTAAYVDTSGNVAPSAPSLVDVTGFDASAAYTFAWAFGDSNPDDTQTAYELIVQRVSDNVDIVSTGKVASTTASRLVAAAALANGVNYRWRVRTYDVLDTVGAWSAWDAFTTAATGTLTITSPAADNPVGLDTSSLNIAWSYVQANGYTQTQRRVRVIRVSDSAVLSDTTMQASTVGNYTVTALPTDVPVRIEVSIVTNAPGTPTIGPVNRLLTTSYGAPMAPLVTLEAGESFVTVTVDNPPPSGSRPEVVRNVVERRDSGIGDYRAIASIAPDSSYNDHAVASGKAYDYRVRGITA